MNRSITEKREILAARIFHVATSMHGPTLCIKISIDTTVIKFDKSA